MDVKIDARASCYELPHNRIGPAKQLENLRASESCVTSPVFGKRTSDPVNGDLRISLLGHTFHNFFLEALNPSSIDKYSFSRSRRNISDIVASIS